MAEINVNQANQEQLTELEYVGPVLAERIIEYRESEGGFEKLEKLKEVKGIGAKLYSDITAENNLNLESSAVDLAQNKKNKVETKTKESKIELNIPEVERVENPEENDYDKANRKSTVQGKSRAEHCPALRSCPVYKEKYCAGNYEECARYKIIDSSLNTGQIPKILLPDEKERAEAILENNL
ncbi:MAG: ComEA family DNA-binding protein [Bacillota bacterium]